jgi:hypothetical protein
VENPSQEDSDRGVLSTGLRFGFRFEKPSGGVAKEVRKLL